MKTEQLKLAELELKKAYRAYDKAGDNWLVEGVPARARLNEAKAALKELEN